MNILRFVVFTFTNSFTHFTQSSNLTCDSGLIAFIVKLQNILYNFNILFIYSLMVRIYNINSIFITIFKYTVYYRWPWEQQMAKVYSIY